MSDDDKLIQLDFSDERKTTPGRSLAPEVGAWYWVKGGEDDEGELERRLACVTHVGSNYAEMRSVYGGTVRVHFDEFVATCEPEPHPEPFIDAKVEKYQARTRVLMAEVIELTRRLSINPRPALTAEGEASNALVVVSGTPDVGATGQVDINTTVSLTIWSSWYGRIYKRGIDVVDGCFVLDIKGVGPLQDGGELLLVSVAAPMVGFQVETQNRMLHIADGVARFLDAAETGALAPVTWTHLKKEG